MQVRKHSLLAKPLDSFNNGPAVDVFILPKGLDDETVEYGKMGCYQWNISAQVERCRHQKFILARKNTF